MILNFYHTIFPRKIIKNALLLQIGQWWVKERFYLDSAQGTNEFIGAAYRSMGWGNSQELARAITRKPNPACVVDGSVPCTACSQPDH